MVKLRKLLVTALAFMGLMGILAPIQEVNAATGTYTGWTTTNVADPNRESKTQYRYRATNAWSSTALTSPPSSGFYKTGTITETKTLSQAKVEGNPLNIVGDKVGQSTSTLAFKKFKDIATGEVQPYVYGVFIDVGTKASGGTVKAWYSGCTGCSGAHQHPQKRNVGIYATNDATLWAEKKNAKETASNGVKWAVLSEKIGESANGTSISVNPSGYRYIFISFAYGCWNSAAYQWDIQYPGSKTVYYEATGFGDWSGWTDTVHTKTASKQVETRTVYRYPYYHLNYNMNGGRVGYGSSNNMLTGLDNQSTTTEGYMTYSIKDGVVTVKANADDGYGFTTGRVQLTANRTYRFTMESSGTWGSDAGTDTVQAYLMLDGVADDTRIKLTGKDCTFTPSKTGEYWLRLDVNKSGKTHTFKDLAIFTASYNATINSVALVSPTREGYTFGGWYESSSLSGTKVTSLSGSAVADKTYYAKWNENSVNVVYHSNGATSIKYNGTEITEDELVSNYGQSFKFATTNSNGLRDGDNSTGLYLTKTGYTWQNGWTIGDANGNLTSTVISETQSLTGESLAELAGIDISTGNATVHLHGTWAANKYTVKFDANGGSGTAMADQAFTYNTAKALSANAYTRSGYTFKGWSKSSTATSATYTDKQSVKNLTSTNNGTVTLYAVWAANSYTATFNANGGGTVSPSTITKAYGAQLGTLPTVSRSGYTFAGWWTAASGGSQISTTTTMPLNGATYYAHWTPNTYTITYDANGGSGAPAAQSFTFNGGEKISTTKPTKAGYTFVEWQASHNGQTFQPGDTIPDGWGNFTLVAQWTPITYQVKFNGNSATSGSMNNQSFTYDVAQNLTANAFKRVHTVTYNYNGSGVANTTDTSTWTFQGWATTISGSVVYTDKQSVSNLTTTSGGTVNLYAKWNCTQADYVKLPYPSRAGYTFLGWNEKADGSGTMYEMSEGVVKKISLSSDITLYAQWSKNSYTATFNANGGGTVSPSAIAKSYGEQLGTLPTVSRSGYTFDGWWTAASGGSQISATSTMPANNVTYYAHWKANTYTVVFNGNGATSGSMSNQTFTYDVAQNLTANAFKRAHTITYNYNGNGAANTTATANATFNGWATSASGSKAYNDKQSVSNLATSGTKTLYANWTLGTVTLPTPTRTGYTFIGWYDAASGGNKIGDGGATYRPTANKTVYAQWSTDTYQLSINPNGGYRKSDGSTSIVTVTKAYGQTENISVRERIGYTLTGYTMTNSNNGSTTDLGGASFVFDSSTKEGVFTQGSVPITLKANWSENSITFKYYGNNGNSNSFATWVAKPASTTWPNNHWDYTTGTYQQTKTGYTATGYYGTTTTGGILVEQNESFANYSALCAKYGVDTQTANTTINIYAQWTPNTYKVTLNNQGANTAGTTAYWYQYQTTKVVNGETVYYWKDSALSQPLTNYTITIPEKTGYTFGGYYTGTNGSGTQYVDASGKTVNNLYNTVASDSTLYAKWTANTYTVTYDANGGSGAPATQSFTFGKGESISSTVPTRTGYEFTGWKATHNNQIMQPGESIPTSWGSFTLQAQWKNMTYTISYNANGGSGSMSSHSVIYGNNVKILDNTFTRHGYNFAGWTTNSNGTNDGHGWFISSTLKGWEGTWAYTNGQYGISDNKLVLYAMWTPKTFTISYNANGGSGSMSSHTVTYGNKVKILDNGFNRQGYSFVGWTTNSDGSADGHGWSTNSNTGWEGTWSYDNGQYGISNNKLVLYARWTPNSGIGYTVKHYKMNLDGSTYTLANTETLYGTADASITPNTINYEGFTAPSKKTTTIKADGSTLVEYYYTRNKYTLTIQAGDSYSGVGSSTTTGQYYYGYEYTLNGSSNAGYHFKEWNSTDDTVLTSNNVNRTMPAYNITWKVYSTANAYSIKFDGNGATSGSMSNLAMTYGVSKNLTANAFQRKFTVTYNGNGGTTSTASATATSSFAGWATSASGNKVYNDKASVSNLTTTNNGTYTLYAKWNDQQITLGTATRAGKTFLGWNTKADGTGTSYSAGQQITVSSNMTLYAQWDVITYELKIDPNGGYRVDGTNYNVITVSKEYGQTETISERRKTGYNLVGYTIKNTASGSTTDIGGAKLVFDSSSKTATFTQGTVSVTLVAQWEAKVTTAIFYRNTSTSDTTTATQSFTYAVSGQSFSDKGWANAKPGYRLIGWNTNRNATTAEFGLTSGVTNDWINGAYPSINLYGVWAPNPYTVIFNGNGNTGGSMNNQSISYDTTSPLSPNGFTKTGYKFVAWTTNANGTGTSYTDKASVKNLASPGGSITLYAKWAPNTDTQYTVKHYQMNLDGTNYTLKDTEILIGETNASITPNTKNYAGFTAPSKITTTIKADGTTLVEYYYSRNKYSLSIVGLLDDVQTENITGFGLVDVSVNGSTVASDVSNFSQKFYYGSTYDIFNIEALKGMEYLGITEGALEGTISGDVKVRLKFTSNSYTINYNYAGGTVGTANPTKYKADTATFTISNPVKLGYTLTGWVEVLSTEKWTDGFVNMDTGAIEESNASYPYSVYSEPIFLKNGVKYTLTAPGYDGVRWRAFATDGSYIGSVSSSETYTPTQDCYVRILFFNGLSSTNRNQMKITASLGTTITIPKGSTANRSYTANWQINQYTVTFNGNNGTVSGVTSITKDYGTALGALPSATRTGYTFKEWNTNADGTGTKITSSTTMPANNFTAYAIWTANTYVVKFNGNGATSGSMNNQNFTYDVAQALSANAFKRAYTVTFNYNGSGASNTSATANSTFNGWAETAGGQKKYDDKQSVKNLSATAGATVNLYANWTLGSVSLPTPTRTGYTFLGWYDAASGGNKIGDGGASFTPSANTTLYAQWKINSYTMTFNANGCGTVNPATITKNYNEALGTLPTLTVKTGYTFTGWNTSSAGTGTAITSETKMPAGNSTVYAICRANTYEIEFKGNGATSGSMANMQMTYDAAKNLTTNAFKRVYTVTYNYNGNGSANTTANATATFVNWKGENGNTYTDKQSVVNLTAVDKDVFTMTAQWTLGTVTLPTPTRTGYTFLGWYDAASGGNKIGDGGATYTPTSNKTIYAQWKINQYTATFDSNGGLTASPQTITKNYGSALGTLPTTSRTGYTFLGWYTAKTGGTKIENTSTMPAGNVTYYAQWKAHTYSIEFNSNGGSGSMPSMSMTYDVAKNLTANSFTRTGYTFVGWNTAADGRGTSYSDKVSVKNLTTSDGGKIVLYAQWKAHTYTIKFDANTGSGTMSDISMTYDVAKTLPSNTFTKTGHYFDGWNTAANGSGTSFADKASVKNLAVADNATVTLYAQWKQNPHTVTFVANKAGAIIDPETMTVLYGDMIGTLPSSYSKGMEIIGWYTNADGTGTAISETTIITGDLTVYAQWKVADYDLIFHATGGTVSPAKKTIIYDQKYGELPIPIRSGFIFAGWYTEEIGGNIVSESDKMGESDVHLYAHWYSADFASNDLMAEDVTITVTSGNANVGGVVGAMDGSLRKVEIVDVNSNDNEYALVADRVSDGKVIEVFNANGSVNTDRMFQHTLGTFNLNGALLAVTPRGNFILSSEMNNPTTATEVYYASDAMTSSFGTAMDFTPSQTENVMSKNLEILNKYYNYWESTGAKYPRLNNN